MHISSNFDAGNISVVNTDSADDIQLEIRQDINADYRQWFYFKVESAKDIPCMFKINNAWQATYPEAWPGSSVVVSHNHEDWLRIPMEFDGRALSFRFTPEHDSVYVALFAPYSFDRHQRKILEYTSADACTLVGAAKSVQGRDVELLQLGSAHPGKPKIWVIARQHPGETMAQWYIEGLLERLCNSTDSATRALLEASTFYIVPCMNPDGGVSGNIRTNAAGIDLNRAWLQPDKVSSPEVHYVLEQMDNIGVDLFLDIHGDEEITYVFPAGCEAIPGYSVQTEALKQRFYEQYQAANAGFQFLHGYPMEEPGKADLSIANNQVGHRFNCLSLTLEMPFKDNANAPDPVNGWSPSRSKQLGAAVLEPILEIINEL